MLATGQYECWFDWVPTRPSRQYSEGELMFPYRLCREGLRPNSYNRWVTPSDPHEGNKGAMFVVLYMHAPPGIVDGARKTSQVEKGRCGGFSSLPTLDTIAIKDQCITPFIKPLVDLPL